MMLLMPLARLAHRSFSDDDIFFVLGGIEWLRVVVIVLLDGID